MSMRAWSVLVAALLCACVDRLTEPDKRSPPPALDISDGAHNSGNSHFYFLPPMVGQPTTTGTLDASLSPTVTVCELTYASGPPECAQTIAQFTRTSGTDGQTIQVSSSYMVNWNTDRCTTGPCSLNPRNDYRVAVSVGDLVLGFADVETANSAGELHDINTNEYIPLVNGRTLPVKFLIQQGLGATRGIYVSNNGSNSVTLYPLGAGGNIAPLATVAGGNTGLSRPRGIAFDEPGNLYVANSTGGDGTGSITEYAAGSTGDVAPTVTIAGSNAGLADPRGLAFDASGRLFAANASILTVTSYAAGAAGNAAPLSTLNTPDGPFGVAFDGSGRLYLTTAGLPGVAVYAAGANGNAAPIATIAGANTGLSQPRGIAFDGSGRLYVVDQGNRVAVFAAGATGNVSPVALIAGPSTGLNSPFGVIVDALGRVYVTNEVGNSVTVYASGASGDATPVTTIAGSNTGLDGPLFIGIF